MVNEIAWRQDPLTGLGNILAFLEHLLQHAKNPKDGTLTIVYFDLVNLSSMNRAGGRPAGDQALRWLALALQDELGPRNCFRLRGDEFAALLDAVTSGESEARAKAVRERFLRLTKDQNGPWLKQDPIHIAVLHVEKPSALEAVDIVIAMEATMQQLKADGGSFATLYYPVNAQVDLREMVAGLITRTLELGGMVDQAMTQAETDPLTGLPNTRAMRRLLQTTTAQELEHQGRFALLLVDGDNLRQVNKISYQAGDELIQKLATHLGQGLRQQDKLARWRMGDEFLILLPGAQTKEAMQVARRLVATVEDAEWVLPVTISVGIALFPEHGQSSEALEEAVEAALAAAKAKGKNQALLYQG